jgi:hypothetical protein
VKASRAILVVLIATGVLLFLGWTRMPDIIAKNLSKKMKVSVQMDDIDISLNSIEVMKLDISNPKGSILNTAFSADQIQVLAPLGHYLDKQIEIEEVSLDKVYLGLEFDSPRSKEGNWTTIMQNFKQRKVSSGKSGHRVLIKKLIITHISIDLAYRSEGGKIKKLGPINRLELTNVTSEGGGIPSDQITDAILTQILRSVFKMQNLKDMLENVTPSDRLTQPFMNLFGTLQQETQEHVA